MEKVQVFISHAHGESELATLLKKNIVEHFIGLINVFVSSDFKSIGAGDDWYKAVMNAAQLADIHVVLCSQDSIASRWINIELGVALTSPGRKILPICHTDLSWSNFQVTPLSSREGFDAGSPQGLELLYSALARSLGSSMPKVDFQELAGSIREIEMRYLAAKQTKAKSGDCPEPDNLRVNLPSPRVLCIASLEFQQAVRRDIHQILAAFPAGTRHVVITDPGDLRAQMAVEQFDIIHVANQTCPATGDLIFDCPVPGACTDAPKETVPASMFAGLVKECRPALVVLANNETLPLLVKLLPVTSVAFAEEPVDIKMLIAWLQTFYKLLADNFSLADACRKTYAQHQIPVRLYPRLPVPSAVVNGFAAKATTQT